MGVTPPHGSEPMMRTRQAQARASRCVSNQPQLASNEPYGCHFAHGFGQVLSDIVGCFQARHTTTGLVDEDRWMRQILQGANKHE